MSNFYGFPPLLNVVGAQLDDDLLNPGLPSQIRSNFLEPAQQGPQGSRDLQALREVGIDPSFDLEEAKSRFLADQVSTPDFIQNYPTLAASLASKDFVQIARDDMGNIIETEGWWNEIANAYEVSRDTVGIGSMGTRAMLEGRDLYPYERRKIERARQLQRAHMQSEPGLMAASAELLGTMQETLGYSLAAGAATGAVFPPAAPFVAGGVAFATSYNLEAGNLYADLVMDGYTPAQAAEIGATYGAFIAGFEAVGLKGAGAGLRALGREALKGKASDFLKKQTAGEAFKQIILKDYALKGIGLESLTEGVQEVWSELAKRRASELYRPDNLYEPEYLETFGQAAWHTAKGMVLLGGLPAGGRLAIENMRAAESFHAEREAVRAADNYAKSKAPDAAEQVSREAGETLPDDKYYLRAQGFMETVRDIERQEREAGRPEGEFRKTLDELQPGLLEKLEEAAARDGDVELSKTDFDKMFSKTEAFKAAFQHVAHREDGMTVREREEFMGIREKMTKDMEEEQKAELQKMEEVEDELVEIRQTVRAAVEPVIGEEAAKGMDVAANMTVLTSFITRAAAVQGISPKEFVERYMPEIQQRVLGEEAAEAAPVIEVVEAAPEMSEAMTEANEAPVTRVTPVVASAATENPQRQAAEPEPAAEPEVEVTPEVEPEVTEEAAPAPEPAAEPETDETQLFEGDATPEQIAKFLSLLPPRNAQGLFDLSNEKRNAKTGRYDNMGAALRAMESGEITRQQRDAIVDIYKPVLPDTRIYEVATPETMRLALNKNQKPLVNAPVEEGRRVGLRLDIKAVTHPKHPARVIAIHEREGKGGGKHIRYTNVARVTNAEMSMVVTRAADVAAGRRNKDKLGVIYGDYVSTTVEEATKIAQEALTDPAWRQVGIDPERHGYYYDRKTGEPLVSADEVVQVGSQVFAKNAKVAGKEQFLYSKEAAAAFDESAYRPEVVAWAKDTFGNRVAPNGKPAYQNFVRWFGDSKVVDAEGKPLVVYHGTQSADPFEIFRPSPVEQGRPIDQSVGVHFAVDKKIGEFFGRDGGRVLTVYLGLQNPRKIQAEETRFDQALIARDVISVVLDNESGRDLFVQWAQKSRGVDSSTANRMFDTLRSGLPITANAFPGQAASRDTSVTDYVDNFDNQLASLGQEGRTKVGEEYVRQLKEQGFDGLEYTNTSPNETRGASDLTTYLAFDPDQIKSTQNLGDFSADPRTLYSKENGKKVLGKAGFEGTDAIKKILLDPDAKPTTLMHELMHWNLELMSDMSLNIEQKEESQRNALEKQVLKDTTALLEWSGYEGTLEGWRQMDVDARRPFHEAIAASFELFLYKGEAPSRQLKGIFQRLLNYLNESYKQIVKRFQKEYQDEFKRPLPALNDDVRAIFGRMMSAERDTMDFFDQYDMTARLVTREQWVEAGRDEKDYDEYDRDFKDAIAEAQAELTQRRMEEVGWQGRARERTGAKMREERRRTEAKAREDIDADVRETPIFQLQSYIYNGYYRAVDNPKVEPAKAKSTRLSYEAVAAIDEEMAKKLAKRGLLKKEGGIPLDVARNMFGFESNEQMVKELSESRSIKDEVEYRLDRYMIEEQSGLTDPVLVEERIQAAIHNRMRERVIGLELRYILNNGKNTKEELANAREMARDIIGRTPTGDINLTAYNRAAARARRKALKALKDGDMEAAAFAKRQELLNEALIREGGKAREEVRKLVNANKRVFRHRSDKALAKAGYDVVIVKGLRALLSKLGIGGAVQDDPAAAMDAFMRYDPNFAEEFNSEIQHFLNLNLPEAQVGDRRKQMERLTLSDAKRLRTLINQWLKRSKDVRTATLGAKKALVEEHQTELLEQIVKLPAKTRAVGEKESIFGNIRDYFSDMIRFEHLFRRIDGGKDGPWTRVFRMVKDAGNTYRREFLTFMSDMEAALKKLDLKMPGGERTISVRLGQTDVMLGSKNPGAKTDLMHMAMHYYGNASNRERLVAGYAGPNADEATLARTEAEIRTFLQEQIDKGVLTKSDFEWMQGIFDRLSSDDMFGRAQAVMKEVRGYEMTAIQPTPFTIMFPGQTEATEFSGGYIPIKFEDGSPDVLPELEEGELSPEQQNKRMLSILPSFTKERSNMPAPKPLRLGLQGIAHHAGEVYRYIHMTEPSMHIYRVLNGLDGNSPVRQAFIDRFGQRVYQNMLGWLKRSAYQAFERDSSQVSGLLYTLARNANMGIMFLNVGNALQNYTGLVMPMRQLGSRRVLSALTRTFVGKGIREEIAAKSPEMKARLERQIYDIMQGQRKLMTSEDSAWATAKGWINKNAYILQQITQNQVDVAVWQAAYNKETEVALKQDVSEAEAEKRAIAYADSVVRQTQMAGEKEDLSMFESQGGLFKAFFPFKSWFINWMNSAYAQGRIDASQADRNKITELATTYFYMLLIPALLAQAATDLASGKDWDDEDDGYSDDLTEFFIVTQLNQAVGGIPVLSDTWRYVGDYWLDDRYWNNRFPVAPWQSALERLNRSAERALERPGRGTLNLVSEFGTMMGVPTSRIFSRATLIGDEIAGELESESTYDFLRGAVTGQRSDLQRLSR
jgi:hypothetical protein